VISIRDFPAQTALCAFFCNFAEVNLVLLKLCLALYRLKIAMPRIVSIWRVKPRVLRCLDELSLIYIEQL